MNPSLTPGDQSDVHAATRLRDMIMGFRVTQMLHVAAKLNLADHLAGPPQSAEQLASVAGTDPASLRRLMRGLTSIGIFTEMDGSFALTAVGQLLRRDVAGSLSGLAVLYGEEWLWSVYGRMLHSVQTGEGAFVHNWSDPDAQRILQCCRRAMAPSARLLLAERIVPPDTKPSEAKLFDINMLVVVGGRECTQAEYRQLLEASGFALVRVLDTKSPISILEAERATR